MPKVAIFGVGLIGGSLALCFKGKPDMHVVGYSPNPRSVEKYLQRGVVDDATSSIEQAASDADFIFLCMPVGMLEHYLQQLYALPLKHGCIITDVGSTKHSITTCASRLARDGIHFIGGHPMAGSERSGVEAASYYLFENAYYVLTPDETIPDEAFERLNALLQVTRANIVRIDAALHDEIVGATSHLPHIIAVALVNQMERYDAQNELYSMLTAGGFRDITRIASSDPVMWRDVLINNRDVLLGLLSDWNAHIAQFIALLERRDGAGIERKFGDANRFRSGLPERRKGMIASLYDIYVDVPDRPGVIGHIATELGSREINLSNIQIIESRADVPGVLRLSFRNEHAMDQALASLNELGYSVNL